jgi:Eukaryotic protein of unknown function (DUF866)
LQQCSSTDIESLPSAYTVSIASSSAKLIEFECHGFEFTEFDPDVFLFVDSKPQGQFTCVGEEKGTVFKNIDLSDLSWYDYDEKALLFPSI